MVCLTSFMFSLGSLNTARYPGLSKLPDCAGPWPRFIASGLTLAASTLTQA